MKILVNVAGALTVAAIFAVVFRSIAKNTSESKPSKESLRSSLLSAVPSSGDYAVGKIELLDKTIFVAASASITFSKAESDNSIAEQIVDSGWRRVSTPLVRTTIYCKDAIVLKVMGPTQISESQLRYELVASWGDYDTYCEEKLR